MLNLLSDDTRRNPWPIYSYLHNTTPVLHDPGSNAWMIFDYDGVKRALRDDEIFSSAIAATTGRPTPPWLIFFDPPRHTRLRALIMRAFTPGVVAGLEPRIRALSRELLDRAIGRGEMDLAAEFSIPLPMTVIAEMIGIPAADWPRFRRWSDVILQLSHTLSGGEAAAAASAGYFAVLAEMKAWL